MAIQEIPRRGDKGGSRRRRERRERMGLHETSAYLCQCSERDLEAFSIYPTLPDMFNEIKGALTLKKISRSALRGPERERITS